MGEPVEVAGIPPSNVQVSNSDKENIFANSSLREPVIATCPKGSNSASNVAVADQCLPERNDKNQLVELMCLQKQPMNSNVSMEVANQNIVMDL